MSDSALRALFIWFAMPYIGPGQAQVSSREPPRRADAIAAHPKRPLASAPGPWSRRLICGLVVLMIGPWYYLAVYYCLLEWGGSILGSIKLDTAALVLPALLATWGGLALLTRGFSGWSRTVQWGLGVLSAVVGLTGWGLAILVWAAAAMWDVASAPREISDTLQCAALSPAVEHWAQCSGADESFLQGRLLYVEGEGSASKAVCESMRAKAQSGVLSAGPEHCDALRPEAWVSLACPESTPSNIERCYACEHVSRGFDTYQELVGFSDPCATAYVLLGTNVPLEQVAARVRARPAKEGR